MRLLIQNDDYGITAGVSAGIRRAIKEGLVRNTGMFVNMPDSYQAAQDIKDMNVCLGIDVNYVCGRPVSDSSLIPHLVNEKGFFISSGEMAKKNKFISAGELGFIFIFEEDPYPYGEVYLEAENQVKKFIEIVGRKPEYFHMHSLTTPNILKAGMDVAKKYGIYHTIHMMRSYPSVPGTFAVTTENTLEAQIEYNIIDNLLSDTLPKLDKDETYYFICHGGYVDYDLFQNSSMTLRRMKDLDAMLNNDLKQYIADQNIELITYRELGIQ